MVKHRVCSEFESSCAAPYHSTIQIAGFVCKQALLPWYFKTNPIILADIQRAGFKTLLSFILQTVGFFSFSFSLSLSLSLSLSRSVSPAVLPPILVPHMQGGQQPPPNWRDGVALDDLGMPNNETFPNFPPSALGSMPG